ncbi:MAG: MFS transporter [Deltaproteobacteria bacterium]|nr:MFS transporter [Deltaproteobacteria bacterium]MBW2115659.1 MFS transporter [Deltaproteobacteria bacterium]MBW2358838.1 MFS transporter [Deltaproteobacteria bacterium]
MDQVKQKPMYRFLMVLTIASTVGLQAWLTLFNNFAVEVAGLQGKHIGVIQSVREFPGFLALLAVYVMLIVREHRLSALSILFLGLGLGATGLFPSYSGLLITTVIMSFGFHYYETTNQSLTLQYFDEKTSPWVFGRLRSLAAASSIAVGIFIYLVAPLLSFIQIYLLIGCLIAAAAVWGLIQEPTDRDIVPQRKRMIFRRKYWLFYFLTFMGGARRQIFMAFAVFLLVKRFSFSVQEVTALFVINNLINYFLAPLIGKSIIRFGERKVLSLEYLSLIFIFLAYATVESRIVVAILYILDHIFFNFAMAIRTYFQKVGDPRDIAPSMAMGFTINHLAAVFLPAIGGILWMVDYRIPFVAGAFMSLVSLIAVQGIRTGSNS